MQRILEPRIRKRRPALEQRRGRSAHPSDIRRRQQLPRNENFIGRNVRIHDVQSLQKLHIHSRLNGRIDRRSRVATSTTPPSRHRRRLHRAPRRFRSFHRSGRQRRVAGRTRRGALGRRTRRIRRAIRHLRHDIARLNPHVVFLTVGTRHDRARHAVAAHDVVDAFRKGDGGHSAEAHFAEGDFAFGIAAAAAVALLVVLPFVALPFLRVVSPAAVAPSSRFFRRLFRAIGTRRQYLLVARTGDHVVPIAPFDVQIEDQAAVARLGLHLDAILAVDVFAAAGAGAEGEAGGGDFAGGAVGLGLGGLEQQEEEVQDGREEREGTRWWCHCVWSF
mmetsp:Transcript_15265/g.31163  ORF Transcript_15265/g.31163 Transcript_15265/m.31163 type:complete len:333 (-) Transcript_15265:76-1074(-)